MSSTATYPWLVGNYIAENFMAEALVITGNKVIASEWPENPFTLRVGEFGEVEEGVGALTKQERYTLELRMKIGGMEHLSYGVLVEEGRMCFKSLMGVCTLEWLTEEEAERRAGEGDSMLAPTSHYTPEPGRQGALIWLTGPPGLGKSTTAQLLSRLHGWRYYEADCFFSLRNPYIPPHVDNPSMAQVSQSKFVGEGVDQRRALAKTLNEVFENVMGGKDYDEDLLEEGYRAMCQDILQERARLGGDWAVAGVLFSRRLRQFVRQQLGPELQVVVLDMSLEEQVARITTRHQGDATAVEMMKNCYKLCEPVGEDEEGAVDVKVDPDMSAEDVLNIVLEKTESE